METIDPELDHSPNTYEKVDGAAERSRHPYRDLTIMGLVILVRSRNLRDRRAVRGSQEGNRARPQ
jgi:hypothetical protein